MRCCSPVAVLAVAAAFSKPGAGAVGVPALIMGGIGVLLGVTYFLVD